MKLHSRTINKTSQSFFAWIVWRIGYRAGSEWRRLNFGPANCWRYVGLGFYWRTSKESGEPGMA